MYNDLAFYHDGADGAVRSLGIPFSAPIAVTSSLKSSAL